MSEATFFCPCCARNFTHFLPFGVIPRPNAMCPGCGSLERHRMLWLYLKDRRDFFIDTLTVLHFAPEDALRAVLSSLPNLDYITADIEPGRAMREIDITDTQFEANRFDVILCMHVLEHVPDDRKALSELFRILKPGGWAIVQSPIDRQRLETFEDPTVVSPKERERLFGQRDHVRVYGRDYSARLEQAGFNITIEDYAKRLSPERIAQCALGSDLDILVCSKAASSGAQYPHSSGPCGAGS